MDRTQREIGRATRGSRQGFTLVEIMIVTGIVGLLASMAVPSFIKARTISQSKSCINNLRIMDSAKEQAAMEYGWGPTTAIANGSADETNILAYIKRHVVPVCPGSGTYSWNNIGTDPSCTRGGTEVHTL